MNMSVYLVMECHKFLHVCHCIVATTFYQLQGAIGSIVEVSAISTFVYLILPEIPSGIGIMLLSGVFFAQIAIDTYYTPKVCFCFYLQRCKCKCLPRRQRNHNNDLESIQNEEIMPLTSVITHRSHSKLIIFEDKIVKFFALLLQLTGILGFSILTLCSNFLEDRDSISLRIVVGYPIFCIVQSILWTNVVQDLFAKPGKHDEEKSENPQAVTRDKTVNESEPGREDINLHQDDQPKSEDIIATARFKSSM